MKSCSLPGGKRERGIKRKIAEGKELTSHLVREIPSKYWKNSRGGTEKEGFSRGERGGKESVRKRSHSPREIMQRGSGERGGSIAFERR